MLAASWFVGVISYALEKACLSCQKRRPCHHDTCLECPAPSQDRFELSEFHPLNKRLALYTENFRINHIRPRLQGMLLSL